MLEDSYGVCNGNIIGTLDLLTSKSLDNKKHHQHKKNPAWFSNWFVYCPRIVPVKISKQKVFIHCYTWCSHERSLVGGIPTPLKNMSSSVGMIIPFPTVSGKSCHKIPWFQSPPTRILFSNFAKVSSRSFPRAASAVHPTARVFLGGSSCEP